MKAFHATLAALTLAALTLAAATPSRADAFDGGGPRGPDVRYADAPVDDAGDRGAGRPCLPGRFGGPLTESCSYRSYTPDDRFDLLNPF